MSPTAIGILLLRVEVKNNSTDVVDVDNYLNNSTLVAVNPRTPNLTALTAADINNLSNNTAISTLQVTARLQSRAVPETAAYKAAVPAILARAGIRDGSYVKPSGVNLTRASELVNSTLAAFEATPSNYPNLGNGWSILNSTYSGTFESGTAIVPRVLIAVELYLQNMADEALYPTLGTTQLSLTDKESYLFSFSGRPPVADDGFWSLTMYDNAGYLVANAKNTYAIGDRSNITFPNGDLVYSGGTQDGSFKILLQDGGVTPPSNWTAK